MSNDLISSKMVLMSELEDRFKPYMTSSLVTDTTPYIILYMDMTERYKQIQTKEY